MPAGKSGKLIAIVDLERKLELRARLARENLTYKDWLVEQIDRYLSLPVQQRLPLPGFAEPPKEPE